MVSVSIVIPCRNEERYIGKCLDSIINCNFPSEMLEVYVCDGLSNDNTLNVLNNFISKYANIHLLVNLKLTTSYALNIGIRQSNSEVIIILSAHSEIHPDFISNCVKELENDTSLGCVGGVIHNIFENKIGRLIGHAMSSSFGVGNAYFRTGRKEGYVDTVAFGAYKKKVFQEIGYFDEELTRNQDDEFNFRLIKYGYKIALKKNIKSNYYVRASLRKLFSQYFQYGYWKVFVNIKHKTITSFRQLVPFCFVLFIITGFILSFMNKLFLNIFSIILILYLLTGIYFAIRKTHNINELVGIICSFFILHFSYGLGYLAGILRFVFLKKKPGLGQVVLDKE